MNKELMELIRSIVNKCVDEHTYIDNDEVSLERENKQHYKEVKNERKEKYD